MPEGTQQPPPTDDLAKTRQAFLEKLCRYYMEFLETDFKKRQIKESDPSGV